MNNTLIYKTIAFEESPQFKGDPKSVTFSKSTNDNRIATTNFVHNVFKEKKEDIHSAFNELSTMFENIEQVISSSEEFDSNNSLTSWFRQYSNGWCEEGGRFSNSNNIVYPKCSFPSSAFYCYLSNSDDSINSFHYITNTNILESITISTSNTSGFWEVVGQIKSEN